MKIQLALSRAPGDGEDPAPSRAIEFGSKRLVRTSKAGKVRHIELTAEGLEFFQEITAGRGSTEFLCHRAGAAWGKSHQQRPLADACQAAKINPPASFHTLRHT